MDESNDQEIGQLLRLKKFEQPPAGYFEDFLHEFHRRQRDELLRQPLWKIALERAQDFMFRVNVARLASYPVAAAAVAVCAAVITFNIAQTPSAPRISQNATVTVPQASPVVDDASWNLATPVSTAMSAPVRPVLHARFSTHRSATPPRYVLDSMPVSYESTLRF
ncbi:MAG: hypothetical protein M3R59_07455 [Verrucomicrobiota bacterium]|nr:hypothetical protein [Verrucomicrobiota bacterium]